MKQEQGNIPSTLLALVIMLSLPLSTWCICGEKWRNYGEKERIAFITSHQAFQKSLMPLVRSMLGDINRGIREPGPRTEDQGRKWIIECMTGSGKKSTIAYYLNTGTPSGVYREEEGKRTLFPGSIKSIEFRRTGKHLWQCAFTQEVHTVYGYMGDDWVLFTFGKPDR